MPYKSRAQQRFFHAAEERGEMPHKVVKEFDKATTKKQYAHLPEHKAKGGTMKCECPNCGHRYDHGGEVEQEEREHPWMTEEQADRVASDHEYAKAIRSRRK